MLRHWYRNRAKDARGLLWDKGWAARALLYD